jgi:hypothetical protein
MLAKRPERTAASWSRARTGSTEVVMELIDSYIAEAGVE